MNEVTYVMLVEIRDQGMWLIKQQGDGWVKHRKIDKIIDLEPEETSVERQKIS